MPNGPKRGAKAAHKPPPKPRNCTNETHGYLSGLYTDFSEQVTNYIHLVHQLLHMQARVELAEKNLHNTREVFSDHITKCKETVPEDWSVTLKRAQYVGARLSEACQGLLREHRRLPPHQLLDFLNDGQYRFRTPTPFREIHGALVKQAWAARDGEDYVWVGQDPQLQLIGRIPTGEKKAS